MKKVFLFLCWLLLTLSCTGQAKRELFLSPAVSVKDLYQVESPVRISDVKIEANIVGTLAVTTVEMILYNPNERILEGELQFPLAEGLSVSRFALDINGRLREGVVVEKSKGQEVFESVVRTEIDPGLLEKTQGNNFRTRIYPLPAKGSRRVVIAYEQELVRENEKCKFILPVEYGGTLDLFTLNVVVNGNPNLPEVHTSEWGDFRFDKEGDAYAASFSAKNFSARGQIVFSLPVKDNREVFTEKGKVDKHTYFYSKIYPQIKESPKRPPAKIALYWDSSSSMSERNFPVEEKLLSGYFNSLGDVTVELYTFNYILNKPEKFKVSKGNWKELREALLNISYDGATKLGILDMSKTNADEIFLFTDGLSSFGEMTPLTGGVPVYVVNSVLSADYSMLNYIASTTGGKFINLTEQTWQDAVKSLKSELFRLISAEYNKSEISDFVGSVKEVNNASGFSVAGRINAPKATIVLNFGTGNKITDSYTIAIDTDNVGNYSNILERVWAEKKINELDLLYDKNKEEIEDLGRKYNIITRNTSLIVLDRVEDYAEHRIIPPADLLNEYNNILDKINVSESELKKSQIDKVVSLLEERIRWWNKDFPKTQGKKQIENKNRVASDINAEVLGTRVFEHVESVSQDLLEESAAATIRFIPPVIQGDESVRDKELLAMEELSSSEGYIGEEMERPQSISGKIELKEWNPDMPYIKELENKTAKELYSSYLKIKEQYKSTPSFFLDVAALFEQRGLENEALIILSNLAEMEPENYRLLRVLAYRLMQLGYTEYAIDMFNIVLKLRPEEPQSYRDQALAYAQNKEYKKAVNLLYKVVENRWDSRFPGIELIAVEEMNAVIKKANLNKIPVELNGIDKRLIHDTPVDIRIVLNWDTDNSDMDLWVTDPYGEKCFYNNNLTHIGGLISDDFTGGYGPEEFLIKEAVKGKYKIQANYYGSREQTIIGPTTVYLDIYIYYMDGKEKKETITLRLSENKEVIDIGEINFDYK